MEHKLLVLEVARNTPPVGHDCSGHQQKEKKTDEVTHKQLRLRRFR